MSEQLTLFSIKPDKQPTWDDVQKGRAKQVPHERYTQPCRKECMWHESISNFGGIENCCYLFHKPVINGKCPSTITLEWV